MPTETQNQIESQTKTQTDPETKSTNRVPRSGQATAATGGEFAEATTLKEILNISDAVMDQAMGIAYQLYLTRRFAEAETVCRGLIACDHRYWWSYSLHASVLRRMGREEEALSAVEEGLKYEPGQAKLALMRTELLITLARKCALPLAGTEGVPVLAGAAGVAPRPSIAPPPSIAATR